MTFKLIKSLLFLFNVLIKSVHNSISFWNLIWDQTQFKSSRTWQTIGIFPTKSHCCYLYIIRWASIKTPEVNFQIFWTHSYPLSQIRIPVIDKFPMLIKISYDCVSTPGVKAEQLLLQGIASNIINVNCPMNMSNFQRERNLLKNQFFKKVILY